MDNKKLKKMSMKLCSDDQNFMNSFRKNIDMYVAEKDITLREIAEEADMPFDTLRNFLYKDRADCKLSTAIKLAKAFRVSIDELVGSGTISEISRESMQLCRNLPENDLYLVRWFIRHLSEINKSNEKGKRYVSVMQVECNNDGNLKLTTSYKKVEITDLYYEIRGKVFFGITMPCEHYMPTYTPYDILLIANDRFPRGSEKSVIRIDNNLYIAQRKVNNGIAKYYSIRDGKYRVDESDVDEVVGYVAETIKNQNIQ